MSKSLFFLEFAVSSCKLTVEMNNSEILSLVVEDGMSSMLPINNGISKSGLQKCRIKLSSLDDKPFRVEQDTLFKVMEYDATNQLEFKDFIKEVKFEDPENGNKPSYTIQADFNAVVPYELNTLIDGVFLTDIDELDQKLNDYFNYFKGLFQRKEYAKIQQAMQRKENNVATAMYLSPEESEARLNSLFFDMKNGFELDEQAIALPYFFENGKVVSFRDSKGRPAIRLVNQELGEELFIELNVMMDAASRQFIVV